MVECQSDFTECSSRGPGVVHPCTTFGKAPKGIKDIFHQCRNFERAYARALEVRACIAFGAALHRSASARCTHAAGSSP